MYWLLIVSIALILYPASASAADGRLAGVTVIDFVIEPLDQDNASCGITNDLIDRAVTSPISGSQLRLNRDRQDLKNPYLNVNITSLFSKSAGLCSSSLSMEVRAVQTVRIEASNATVLAPIVLWSWEQLVMGPPGAHGQQVQVGIEEKAKNLVVRWNEDNRPRR